MSKGHGTGKAVTTRAASLQDADRLAVLCEQLGYPATPTQVLSRLEAIQGARDHAVFASQEPSGQATGWVHVFVRQLVCLASDDHLGICASLR